MNNQFSLTTLNDFIYINDEILSIDIFSLDDIEFNNSEFKIFFINEIFTEDSFKKEFFLVEELKKLFSKFQNIVNLDLKYKSMSTLNDDIKKIHPLLSLSNFSESHYERYYLNMDIPNIPEFKHLISLAIFLKKCQYDYNIKYNLKISPEYFEKLKFKYSVEKKSLSNCTDQNFIDKKLVPKLAKIKKEESKLLQQEQIQQNFQLFLEKLEIYDIYSKFNGLSVERYFF